MKYKRSSQFAALCIEKELIFIRTKDPILKGRVTVTNIFAGIFAMCGAHLEENMIYLCKSYNSPYFSH